ncbi:MAG TPA: ABC transporter ATP-binding protein [Firmicutes bacterium]|nr:ABC transporter ATP-binding protein [Candidatus Fermentithermobacillaceae bacterium]
MIQIRNVSKSYGRKRALKDINLSLPHGEIVGLFGENGAGKTTLMKCILGFVSYTGEITLDSEPITPKNISRISFATSEHSFFPNLTAQAHKEFYSEHFPRFSEKRFRGLMDFFGLPMHEPIRGFSTGQKNQFEVILSLCQGADYILMDEPFVGNDVFNREDFYKVMMGILEPTETVLLSTHLIEEVSSLVGRAVLIRQGRIVGDVYVSELEDSGRDLMSYIKETYHYRADRVSKAIDELTGEE